VVEEKENRYLYRPFETSWQGREFHEIFSTAVPLPSSLADTYLFPELKVSVMGYQCESVEEIQDIPLEQLTQISSKSYMECREM
jgi:hypothetical protein